MLNYKLILYRLIRGRIKPKGKDLKPMGINHSYVPREYLKTHPFNEIEKVNSPIIIIF